MFGHCFQLSDSYSKRQLDRAHDENLLKVSATNNSSTVCSRQSMDDTISPVLSRLRNTPGKKSSKMY